MRIWRRPRTCGTCGWTGPRRKMMRWGDGFACRDDWACYARFKLRQAVSEAEYAADLEDRMARIADQISGHLPDGMRFEWTAP